MHENVFMYVGVCLHAYMYVCMHQMPGYVYLYAMHPTCWLLTCTHTCVLIRAYMHAYIHTSVHTNMQTNLHTNAQRTYTHTLGHAKKSAN